MDGLLRWRSHLSWCLQHLHTRQPALLTECTPQYVRRGEHQMQPSSTDWLRGNRGNGIQILVCYQGRRLCQQDLSVPNDQSHYPKPWHLGSFLGRENEIIGYSCLSSLPHCIRHWRHLGREKPAHREVGIYSLLWQPAHLGGWDRTCFPRCSIGEGTFRRSTQDWTGCSVWW